MRLIPRGIFCIRSASRDDWFFANRYMHKGTSSARQPHSSDAFGVRPSKALPEQLATGEHLIVPCLRSAFRKTPLLSNTLMKNQIDHLLAEEILDSRGNPTVQAKVILTSRITAIASVPSGASTGDAEAFEVRDQDPNRFRGKGVLKAVSNISKVLSSLAIGQNVLDQRKLDAAMCSADATLNKSRLGANAILAVSLAVARAAAAAQQIPLYRYIAQLSDSREQESLTLPVPMLNVLNGRRHASNSLAFQEFMVYPTGAMSFAQALRFAAEIFQ